jgi:hypothetical protein
MMIPTKGGVNNTSLSFERSREQIMRKITVYYNNGDKVTTKINGTDGGIRSYYLGQTFNIGDGAGGDLIARAICVDFLDKPIEERHEDALKRVLEIMNLNDVSEDKKHPWIPGIDCIAVRNYLQDVLKNVESEVFTIIPI